MINLFSNLYKAIWFLFSPGLIVPMKIGLRVGNRERFKKYREAQASWSVKERFIYNKLLPVLLFGIVGALGWAIRGTWGYGGTGGALVVGLWWGLVYYYLAYIRGVDARWSFLALGLGIGWGGMNGYGQLLSWIHGNFGILPGETVWIDPAIGFIWLIIIGIEWGGTGAILLAWTLTDYETMSSEKIKKIWLMRAVFPVIGWFVGYYLILLNPTVFFPHYTEALYSDPAALKTTIRTAKTLPLLAALLGVFLGLLVVEIYIRNPVALKSIGIITLGFTLVFPLAACLFYLQEDYPFHWWKIWEELIGFIGGCAIGLVFIITMGHVEAPEEMNSNNEATQAPTDVNIDELMKIKELKRDWRATIVLNLALLMFFLWTFYSMTSPLMIRLEIYKLGDLGEYEIPPERLALLITALISAFGAFAVNLFRLAKRHRASESLVGVENLQTKFIHWATFLVFCGAVGIGGDIMLYFYIAFYWLIVVITLKLNDFLKKNDLQV